MPRAVADGLDAVPDVVEVDVERCAVFTAEPVELAGWNDHYLARQHRPHTATVYNRVQLDTRGTATLALRDVHGGLFNGFVWSWDA